MKNIFFFFSLPFFLLLFLSLRGVRKPVKFAREEGVIGCSPLPGWSDIRPDAEGRYAPVFPGWGHHHYQISTSTDSAQYYFDQGLNLYYSYHLTEAAASFKEAAVKDEHCAMAYWGQALAMGPYYNSTYSYKMPVSVLPVLEKMNQLADQASPKEKDLIEALRNRYSGDTTDGHRSSLNGAYSAAMRGLVGKYPDDPDIKALYIDGVMTEHAWDMWDTKGNPRAWTPELVRYCEEILKTDAYHPAALHYHIHLVEASRHPEVSLPSADKLKDLMPGVAHMVHMASHSYQRTGLYTRGVVINDSANAAARYYDSIAGHLHLPAGVPHYYAVESFCALNGAMYEKAKWAAGHCRDLLAPARVAQKTYLQYLYMIPVFVDVRLGKWRELLDRPVVDRRWSYASLLDDYGRGVAYAHLGDLRSARVCLDSLRVMLAKPVLKVRELPGNAPIKGASVAEGLLEGEILLAERRLEAAVAAYDRAIAAEDDMSYLEPKDWLLPARHYAGACLLKMKRAGEAERRYREDLMENPGNGWALLGMSQCLEMQHKKGAEEYRVRAREAFAQAEVMPVASAY